MSTVTFSMPSITLSGPCVPTGDGVSGKINVDLILATLGFAAGNAAGQINRIYRKNYVLTGAGEDDVDLYDFGGPSVEDALGRPYTLSLIKGVIVQVASTEPTAAVRLGAEGSAAAWKGINGSATVKIADVSAGVPYMWFSRPGVAATDATDHLLHLENLHSSATATVQVLILGSQ